jgi:hypothetical protein
MTAGYEMDKDKTKMMQVRVTAGDHKRLRLLMIHNDMSTVSEVVEYLLDFHDTYKKLEVEKDEFI